MPLQKKTRNDLIVLSVAVGLFAFGFAYGFWEPGAARRYRQRDELQAMLAQRGVRPRHVYVYTVKGKWITMTGYVKTEEEVAELRAEMVKVVGAAEMGKKAFFKVYVVPPGTRKMGTDEDFWASLEK